MGVKRLVLLGSWKVEKAYWGSPLLRPEGLRQELLLGLEQGRDTVLPEVLLRRFFKPFVEDELEATFGPARLLLDLAATAPLSAIAPPASGGVALAIGPEGGWTSYEAARAGGSRLRAGQPRSPAPPRRPGRALRGGPGRALAGRAAGTGRGRPMAAAGGRDVTVLFLTRGVRLFAYGALSVVLVLHLTAAGLTPARVGLLLTLTLLGDTAVSLLVTTRADRAGRRRMLALGAALMIGAGLLFAATTDFWWLLLGATLGILSPSGNEVGPFLAIEQAALSGAVADRDRTRTFARYTLTGSFATAAGALAGGVLSGGLQGLGWSPLASYRAVVVLYALLGVALLLLFARLSPAVEAPSSAAPAPTRGSILGLHRSRGIVLRLSGLFAVDALAGGFIIQSFLAAWFHARFGAGEALLGAIFLGANLLAGLSALAAAPLARRFGLVNTMVFTHLPSNLLLLAIPFLPTLPLAAGLLFLRFSISQLDVPTRQSYTMAVVTPEERAAAAGVTGIARTVGASLAPALAGPLYAVPALAWIPFAICGVLKIGYDLALWRAFSAVKPPEERP